MYLRRWCWRNEICTAVVFHAPIQTSTNLTLNKFILSQIQYKTLPMTLHTRNFWEGGGGEGGDYLLHIRGAQNKKIYLKVNNNKRNQIWLLEMGKRQLFNKNKNIRDMRHLHILISFQLRTLIITWMFLCCLKFEV